MRVSPIVPVATLAQGYIEFFRNIPLLIVLFFVLNGLPRIGIVFGFFETGVVGLTRSLAVELGCDGITVNCICPGPITTGMTARISDEHKAIYARRRTALGRYGDPEEVAHMTLSLCLPAASFLTGAIIPVDGGLMARNA